MPHHTRAKRIWIINHFATTPDMPGGTRHYDFGVELAKRGYDVTIFASDLNYMLRKRIKPTARTQEHPAGVRFVWVRSLIYQKNNWRRAANILSFAFNVIAAGIPRKRPDVIIGSSPHLFAALSGYILAKLKGSRFYLEVRDLWPQVLIEMRTVRRNHGDKEARRRREDSRLETWDLRHGTRNLGLESDVSRLTSHVSTCLRGLAFNFLVLLLSRIEAFLYQVAYMVIVLSEGVGNYITNCGINPERISVLPNGVYLEKFQVTESRTQVRERLGLADEFVVMYTGAHGPANALETILDAADLMLYHTISSIQHPVSSIEHPVSSIQHPASSIQHPASRNVAFVLVGDGPCRDELQQIAQARGLDNVKMLPAVPKSSIPSLLNAADALVITLRSVKLFSYGVSPNKIFEYMASSKPILCAVNGEMADLVTGASAGIAVEPENADALVQAILSLIGDRGKCLVYGTNGRKFVEENFSRSRIVEGLISVLDCRV
jgi:glycosyltransferase involved in cell wall biosynthesis